MADDLIRQIDDLVDEEHQLRSRSEGMSDEERARLRHLEIQLDQCWDLLRQRRARAEAGLDPSATSPRDADTVEGYLQ
jgi:hypothetical protein